MATTAKVALQVDPAEKGPVCLFENPYRLVSLWEIVNWLKMYDVGLAFKELGIIEQHLSNRSSGSFIDAELRSRIDLDLFLPLIIFCLENDLPQSFALARDIKESFLTVQHKREKVPLEPVATSLKNLAVVLKGELTARLFFRVDSSRTRFHNVEHPGGTEVFRAFPSARFDLKEALQCLLFERNVAAGFHMMRAVEVGLRELARDRQTPSSLKGVVDFKEWGIVIGELEESVAVIKQWPNSFAKEAAHKFYNRALKECQGFNDGWRRNLAHVRKDDEMMPPEEADALWGHTIRFLQTVAGKISEGHYADLKWE